mmetsp:Transcript_10375/g.29179  ORF Transcript_10375/g.29179 Transcript_10375/m.29179 type:complete len:491 (-) Transcript_10375:41-1513(-)
MIGFEACCLLFAAPPVDEDEAALVWSPVAASKSRRKGHNAKQTRDVSSANAISSTNPTKAEAAAEGRDEAGDDDGDDDEVVTLQSSLSSAVDDEEVATLASKADGRDGVGGEETVSGSSPEPESDDASSASLLAPDISASADAAVKEAQRVAAEFERKKRERAISAEFERRRAERAAERQKQALEREARQAAARAALLERQRREKEEVDKKRRLASRAAFEERRKEAEELKRKRDDAAAKRRSEQEQQAQAQCQQQQQQQHYQCYQSSAQSSQSHAHAHHRPNIGQQQYQHVPQQTYQAHCTQQIPPRQQAQAKAYAQPHVQSSSPPMNTHSHAKATSTSARPTQHRPYPQKLHSPPTFASSNKASISAAPTVATTPEEVKRSILIAWALEPPNYQQLKPIGILIGNLQAVLPPAFGVKSHEYFAKWKLISHNDVCQNEDALKKAVRKCRFFLHPDKLPSDLDELQRFMCKMIWDILNDAWETHKTGVPI